MAMGSLGVVGCADNSDVFLRVSSFGTLYTESGSGSSAAWQESEVLDFTIIVGETVDFGGASIDSLKVAIT
jgi:hypothetical protein